MKRFLVFHRYHGDVSVEIHVSREVFPDEWTHEECIKHIKAVYRDIVSIQSYDIFILPL